MQNFFGISHDHPGGNMNQLREGRALRRLFLFFATISLLLASPPLLMGASEARVPQQTASQKKTSLCLTMIVKNESSIIERCLDSTKNLVDCISICDTGSTDNTVEIIENYLRKNKIPGKVHRHAWKNFGHNRTLSAQAAQATLKEFGFSLSNTYLVLLDADMLLEADDSFKKNDLKSDAYLLEQKNCSIAYYNTRLVRASLPWECIGVTHEFWACKEPNHQDQLTTLRIDDREDGGCKADKFERDIKLLTQGLQDEPNNERYAFYLAQSYRCLRKYDDAIKWYKVRIEKGGWVEEVWYSKFMIGEMYEEMGFWDQALHWYLDAYQMCPERSEPLQKIASHYRQTGENNLAYLYAKQGARIPYPKEHLLFVSYPAYDYQFDEELSIAAFYTPYKNEGFAAANRIILSRKAPGHVKQATYDNMLFYVENLKIDKMLPIKIDLPLIREGSDERYNLMNPSIQKTKDGYNVICRTVNFSQKGGMEYRSRHPDDPTIRTRNFLVRYDPSFQLLSQREIIEELPRERRPSQVVGLEDCRLIEPDQHLWMFSTTYDAHPSPAGQSLCRMKNDPGAKGPLFVDKLVPLKGFDPTNCEKNWLPFVKENELYAIYGFYPLTIIKINRETGDCPVAFKEETKHDFSRFRGSAAPIAFDDGYLLLVHEVIMKNQRFYLHRFVYLDKDFHLTKVSKPFTFFHQGIEYCCGMTTDHASKKCILSVGFEDAQAFLLFVDLDHIRTLLEPLP